MTDLGDWLSTHTFHHSQFWDILALIREKEKRGLSISLCIPTLNEEKTIGKEVVIFRSELMERYPLVDEIAVIDSGSTDKTLEVASSFGKHGHDASPSSDGRVNRPVRSGPTHVGPASTRGRRSACGRRIGGPNGRDRPWCPRRGRKRGEIPRGIPRADRRGRSAVGRVRGRHDGRERRPDGR